MSLKLTPHAHTIQITMTKTDTKGNDLMFKSQLAFYGSGEAGQGNVHDEYTVSVWRISQ